MASHVPEGIGAKFAKALLALVFMGAAILISEFSARQGDVESSATVSPQTNHTAR